MLAAYKDGKIVSIHRSINAARKAAGATGQVLYAAGYPDHEANYRADGEQLFMAPPESGFYYVSVSNFYDPIYGKGE